MKPIKNISASVRQRLLNRAKSDQRPFNELLQYYAMERFLYRLSKSEHAKKFILKGALMFRVWNAPVIRPTMDIDMLGKTSNTEDEIISQIGEIMVLEVEDDGLVFNRDTIQTEQITEDADYLGIRVLFRGTLGSARIHMQVDIGFGDSVYPVPKESEFPTVLEFPAPRLLCYNRESSIAEKFEAMVKLDTLNSRMKDFYDIWLLAKNFEFDGVTLTEAIRRTFDRRGTPITLEITAFSESFIEKKRTEWIAFMKRLKLWGEQPLTFNEVIKSLDNFLTPIVESICLQEPTPIIWKAPGPWS